MVGKISTISGRRLSSSVGPRVAMYNAVHGKAYELLCVWAETLGYMILVFSSILVTLMRLVPKQSQMTSTKGSPKVFVNPLTTDSEIITQVHTSPKGNVVPSPRRNTKTHHHQVTRRKSKGDYLPRLNPLQPLEEEDISIMSDEQGESKNTSASSSPSGSEPGGSKSGGEHSDEISGFMKCNREDGSTKRCYFIIQHLSLQEIAIQYPRLAPKVRPALTLLNENFDAMSNTSMHMCFFWSPTKRRGIYKNRPLGVYDLSQASFKIQGNNIVIKNVPCIRAESKSENLLVKDSDVLYLTPDQDVSTWMNTLTRVTPVF